MAVSVLEGEGSCCDCCLSNDTEVLKDVNEDLSRCREAFEGRMQ